MNEATKVIEAVKRLLASDISAGEIERATGVPKSATTRYRNGERNLDNMRWYTVEAYYNYAKSNNI